MKYHFRIISFILFIFLLSDLSSLAQEDNSYRVKDVPNVQLRNSSWYVSDPENILSGEQIDSLNVSLKELKDSGFVQMAIVILPKIDITEYGTVKNFGTELFNDWGLGDKEANNGVLLVLSVGDGEAAFEVGYGAESILTDGICKLILVENMLPFLKQKEYGSALIAGVKEVKLLYQGKSDLVVEEISDEELFWWWFVIGIVFYAVALLFFYFTNRNPESPYDFFIDLRSTGGLGCLLTAAIFFLPQFLIALLVLFFLKRKEKNKIVCENCGARGTMNLQKGFKSIREAAKGVNGERQYTFKCKKCGHLHYVNRSYSYVSKSNDDSWRGGSGGSWGGSSGGSWGGSSGGSWGGGSSGGGGASVKF